VLTAEDAEAAEKLGAALGIDATKTVEELAAEIELAAARWVGENPKPTHGKAVWGAGGSQSLRVQCVDQQTGGGARGGD
jgi:hypothetical protein